MFRSIRRASAASFVAALLVTGSVAVAAAPPDTVCRAAKLKAVATKAKNKLNCHAVAAKKQLPVDAECLAKVEDKFATAIAKIEDKGGCATVADGAALEARVDALVSNALALVAPAKRVFVTSSGVTPAFGGAVGADAVCQQRANAVGLTGSYKAWLSVAATNARDRLTQATVPYVRVDGVAIAENWSDLVDGVLAAPIAVSEQGTTVGANFQVWTGTGPNGVGEIGDDPEDSCNTACDDWTTASGSRCAFVGLAGEVDEQWSATFLSPCSTAPVGLYCLEQ